jgi:hypothetical protein
LHGSSELIDAINRRRIGRFIHSHHAMSSPPAAASAAASSSAGGGQRGVKRPHSPPGDEDQKESAKRAKFASTTCGYCKDDFDVVASKDILRVLPCNDMHCSACLIGHLNSNRDAK